MLRHWITTLDMSSGRSTGTFCHVILYQLSHVTKTSKATWQRFREGIESKLYLNINFRSWQGNLFVWCNMIDQETIFCSNIHNLASIDGYLCLLAFTTMDMLIKTRWVVNFNLFLTLYKLDVCRCAQVAAEVVHEHGYVNQKLVASFYSI